MVGVLGRGLRGCVGPAAGKLQALCCHGLGEGAQRNTAPRRIMGKRAGRGELSSD